MDPNKPESLEVYEKNAKIMYYIGFGLLPLSWLMCWIYASKRQAESAYLATIAKKSFILFWVALFIFGVWTALYSSFWTKMTKIAYNVPIDEPS